MDMKSKLAINAFKNDKESHIKINQTICKQCKERFCLYICPGHLYTLNEETSEVQVEFAGCLECGSCQMACVYKAIEWNYPKGDFGIQYRYG